MPNEAAPVITIFGIKNCDTIKKARAWLDERRVSYVFHDYKAEGADPTRLAAWVREVGWEALLNRRGTTFRKLAEIDKTDLNEAKAIALMTAHPWLIKRPVAEARGQVIVGFDPAVYAAALT